MLTENKLSITVKYSKYNFILGIMHNCLNYYPFPFPVLGSNSPNNH